MARRSQAWKGLEKAAADILKGQRIVRAGDYSASLPDVRLEYAKHISIDCKHSQNGFTHHKAWDKLARQGKKKGKRNEETILFIPSEKKTNIKTRLFTVESKYGKPAVLISREKGSHLILATIREEFYQELLVGDKIDEGVFLVVMTIEKLAELLFKRYAPEYLEVAPTMEESWDWDDADWE